jgi:MATE efflux family protein
LSLSRQLTFLLPLLIILPKYLESDGVWAALPASDLLAAIVTAVIMVVFMKRFKKQNKQSQSYEQ